MNKQRVLDTFLAAVTIDSPSWHEAKMAEFCAQRLRAMGFQVDFDDSQAQTGSDTGQIIAFRKGNVPGHIALSAHMDCVVPCIGVKPQVHDGIVTSDGTTVLGADDKSGIAEILEALESVTEVDAPCPDVTVLFSCCEEQGVVGAPCYPEVLFDEPTLCLVLDAEGPAGTIFTAAPRHYRFAATFHGKSAHAGVAPEAGISAIQMAARAVETMPIGRLDEVSTASVGIIEGGRETNIVPDTCLIRGECRSVHDEVCEDIKRRQDEAMRAAAEAFGGTVDIEWELSYPGIFWNDDDPDVQMLVRVADELGLDPHLTVTGGGSDANVLGQKGAKAIPLGSGMTDFHSLRESVRLADLENGALFIEEILKQAGSRR